jgi:hypothetical protein
MNELTGVDMCAGNRMPKAERFAERERPANRPMTIRSDRPPRLGSEVGAGRTSSAAGARI